MLLRGYTNVKQKISDNFIYYIILFIYSFTLLFFCSQFSYLFGDFNIWPDINIYYTIGKGLWFDKIPYKDLFDHKGPLIFFLYGLGYILTPDSFQGMFVIEGLFLFISLFVVFSLSSLFLNKILSLATACIYATCIFSFTAFGGSAEEFILTLMLISLYFLIKFFKENKVKHPPIYMFIHGIMLTAAFLIKLNLVVFWFFPILFILIHLLCKKEYKLFLVNSIFLLLGILSIVLPIIIFFITNNAFSEFIHSYFVVNFLYGNSNSSSLTELLERVIIINYKLLKSHFLCSLFFIISLFSIVFYKSFFNKAGRVSILFSILFMLYTVFYSKFFLEYYFIACLVYVPLGIISFFIFFTKLKLRNNVVITLVSIIILVSLATSIKSKNLFGNSISSLFNRNFNWGFISEFSEVIENDNNNSLICIGIDYSIDVFTKAKIVPTEKYFFIPNIYPDRYPIIYDTQLEYIKSHSVNFIIMKDNYHEKARFYNVILESGYLPTATSEGFTLYKYSK